MNKKLLIIPLALAGLTLITASSCDNQNIVDGKAQIQVPGTTPAVTCYLLEINVETRGGGELAEEYYCVPEDEWRQNRVGDEWVDATGKIK